MVPTASIHSIQGLLGVPRAKPTVFIAMPHTRYYYAIN